MFSRIQHNSNAASALSKSFIIFSKGAIIKDSFKHQRNEHAVRLHANTPQLLVLLGCIDNVLQHVKYHEHYDGFDITFYFHGRELADDNLIISRQIAEWMLSQMTNNEDVRRRYQDTIPCLEGLLKTQCHSLGPLIYQQLYPDKSLQPVIEQHLPDPVDIDLFNETTFYAPKAQSMLAWLQKKLHSKSDKGRDPKHDEQILEDISQRFIQLEKNRKFIWRLMISSLNGKPAIDCCYFGDEYTEIHVLLQAVLILNEQGLMTLDYQKSKKYLEFYALENGNSHEIDPAILGQELTRACGYLKLEFAPRQNFHPGPVVFNRSSTFELMRRGLHWSEESGKKLIKHSILFRVLERNTPLPADLITKIICMNDETLYKEEIRALARIK